jgi:hydroxyacylglutathione hydrolase
LIIKTIPVGPLSVNCYLAVCEQTKKGMIIDPGDQEDVILRYIEGDIDIEYIVLTHAHVDHLAATAQLQSKVGGLICLHSADGFLLENADAQAELFQLRRPDSLYIDIDLKEQHALKIGYYDFQILETPGHSPGGICLYTETSKTCFVGDTLFYESIGRSDLPGGDHNVLVDSIETKIYTLPGNTILYPGHGPKTDVEHEKTMNPFTNQP